MSEPEATVVLVTGPDADTLAALAETVVAEGLAACANLIPTVRSVYRWKGEMQKDDEALAVLKTTRATVEALRARVVELHPYDVPEFLALPVETGSVPYMQWIAENVGDARSDPESHG